MESIVTVRIEGGQSVQVANKNSPEPPRVENGPQVLILASSERVYSPPFSSLLHSSSLPIKTTQLNVYSSSLEQPSSSTHAMPPSNPNSTGKSHYIPTLPPSPLPPFTPSTPSPPRTPTPSPSTLPAPPPIPTTSLDSTPRLNTAFRSKPTTLLKMEIDIRLMTNHAHPNSDLSRMRTMRVRRKRPSSNAWRASCIIVSERSGSV